MDCKKGNTLRKLTNYRPEDRYMFASCANPDVRTVELFDHVFDTQLPYSMKKKKRWRIAPLLSDAIYGDKENEINIDQPITYGMFQFQRYSDLKKAQCVMDTSSKQQYGNCNLSQTKFNNESVNYKSLVSQMRIDKNQRNTEPCYEDDEFTRDNCVYMNEYYYINNPSNPKSSFTWHSKAKKNRSYKIDYLNDEFDDEYYDEQDQSDLDQEMENYTSSRQPMVIKQEDISYRPMYNEPKRRKKRKVAKQKEFSPEEDFLYNREKYFKFIPDDLPIFNIEQHQDSLIKDLRLIVESNNCWISNTFPNSILISLNSAEYDDCKNFIILKLLNVTETDIVTVRILLNGEKLNSNLIQDAQFDGVKMFMDFVKSKLVHNPSSGKIVQIWKFSKPIEKLLNTWKITKVEKPKPIYQHHEEWEKHELKINFIEELVTANELRFTKVETCELCSELIISEDLISLNDCLHRVCEKCFRYQVAYQLHFGQIKLKCPITNCQTGLDCVSILSSVSSKRYTNRKLLLEKQLMEERFSKCYNCKILIIRNSNQTLTMDEKNLDYLCACESMNCGFCGGKQHWPTLCVELKNHTNKILKLNDKRIKPVKPKIPKIDGRECPNCKSYIKRYKSKSLYCWGCRYGFCYLCGCLHTEKCKQNIFRKSMKQFFENYDSYPEPDKLRPKYYCESMHVSLLSRDINLSQLKQKLINIDSKIKQCKYLENDSGIVFAQYSQILNFVESIYISMYQSKRREDNWFKNIMKTSAKNLMFYVYQFQSKIDRLHDILSVNKLTQMKNPEILKLREELSRCLSDAMDYLTKIYFLVN